MILLGSGHATKAERKGSQAEAGVRKHEEARRERFAGVENEETSQKAMRSCIAEHWSSVRSRSAIWMSW